MSQLMQLLADNQVEIPLGGPAVAAAIAALGVTTAMFVRSMLHQSKITTKAEAYKTALLEKAAEEADERWEHSEEERTAERLKYEQLLSNAERRHAELAKELANIRDQRDAALLELARLKGGRASGTTPPPGPPRQGRTLPRSDGTQSTSSDGDS